LIDPKLGTAALIIMLFDPAVTVFSMMLLTESLYLLLISAFLYFSIAYLKDNSLKNLLAAVIMITTATYVRPISLFLALPLAALVFIFNARKNLKPALGHALLILVIFYGSTFPWQWRNHHRFGQWKFSNIANATVHGEGLIGSYARNEDPYSQGLSPIMYYINVPARNVMSLMTRPASFKYFGSDALKKAGKVFSYPWIAFWLAGLLAGLFKFRKDANYVFLTVLIGYFTAATVVGAMWGAGPRFRVPLMPFIAILAAGGWNFLLRKKQGAPGPSDQ
jgi:4-amino-4-deoxy-L-arabinose transferase-like glycosyltransferase